MTIVFNADRIVTIFGWAYSVSVFDSTFIQFFGVILYVLWLCVCVSRLQCQFVDIPSSMMINPSSRFHSDQIALAMHHLIVMMKQRPMTSLSPWTTVADAIKPDIRLVWFPAVKRFFIAITYLFFHLFLPLEYYSWYCHWWQDSVVQILESNSWCSKQFTINLSKID